VGEAKSAGFVARREGIAPLLARDCLAVPHFRQVGTAVTVFQIEPEEAGSFSTTKLASQSGRAGMDVGHDEEMLAAVASAARRDRSASHCGKVATDPQASAVKSSSGTRRMGRKKGFGSDPKPFPSGLGGLCALCGETPDRAGDRQVPKESWLAPMVPRGGDGRRS
jgi:hypothetical protein